MSIITVIIGTKINRIQVLNIKIILENEEFETSIKNYIQRNE